MAQCFAPYGGTPVTRKTITCATCYIRPCFILVNANIEWPIHAFTFEEVDCTRSRHASRYTLDIISTCCSNVTFVTKHMKHNVTYVTLYNIYNIVLHNIICTPCNICYIYMYVCHVHYKRNI